VTLVGLDPPRHTEVRLPPSGYHIGSGFDALVLYATRDQLTVKYTREDSVVQGYTLHLEGICVDAGLVASYERADAAGRTRLPALSEGQPVGRAFGREFLVAIRDAGTFMDPRVCKDWWVAAGC
jgi:hypothetical protein